VFSHVIYNGFDYPPDGMGNHLGLFDRLVFDDLPADNKSLSAIPCQPTPSPYGKVEVDRHLQEPHQFKDCLFFDLAREAWDPELIREQMRKTVDYKRTFNAVAGIYLMWESDRLWDLYAELIGCYDFCVVTSSILDEDLKERGVDFIKLRHPYDFVLADDQSSPPARSQRFRLGVSAGLWPRKNVLLLAQEFMQVFDDDPDVELSIHTRSDVDHPDHAVEYGDLEALRDQCYRIELICHSFSRRDYIEWMRSLDAYCFISAGEGYSVTPREALHLGIPVILHDAHVHREFSHLPGVVRVRSEGTQPAKPHFAAEGYDIGRAWRVSRDGLREALAECRSNLSGLKEALGRRHGEVLAHHATGMIKSDWIEALNRKYTAYRKAVRFTYPGLDDPRLRSMPFIPGELRLSSPYFRKCTGTVARGRVYCLRGQHSPGYCLQGPGSPMPASGRMTVTFRLEVLCAPAGASLVKLEVYDRITGTTRLERSLNTADIEQPEGHLTALVDVYKNQVLDFNVYWPGAADISLSGIRVSPAGGDAPQ